MNWRIWRRVFFGSLVLVVFFSVHSLEKPQDLPHPKYRRQTHISRGSRFGSGRQRLGPPLFPSSTVRRRPVSIPFTERESAISSGVIFQ